jgi:hypothetical protein
MKRLILHRFRSTPEITLGALYAGEHKLFSLERPWLPSAPGGKPRESCIPAGLYDLIPHTRPNGDKVLALINPGLAVFYIDSDRPSGIGRSLILIHVANYVREVIGCIAPGMAHTRTNTEDMVTGSADAMRAIMDYAPDEIEIIGENKYEAA